MVSGTITSGKLRGAHRLFYFRMMLGRVLDAAKPDLIVWEDYAMGARGNNMFHIGELGGVIRLMVWERGIDFLPIAPSLMKSVVALSGAAKKPEIATALRVRFGISLAQHDEADAAGLMVAGEMKLGVRRYEVFGGRTDRNDSLRDAQIIKGKLNSIAKLV